MDIELRCGLRHHKTETVTHGDFAGYESLAHETVTVLLLCDGQWSQVLDTGREPGACPWVKLCRLPAGKAGRSHEVLLLVLPPHPPHPYVSESGGCSWNRADRSEATRRMLGIGARGIDGLPGKGLAWR